MNLIHSKSKETVKIGETITSFRGDKYTVVGMCKPSHISSTGRILVKNEHRESEFYPSVFNCEWSQQEQIYNNMSYCNECYSKYGHATGCPEDDDDYIPDDQEPDDQEPDEDIPEYDVVWDGKGLRCVKV